MLPPRLEVETRFGAPFLDLSVEFSREVADYYNALAATADDALEGEWLPLSADVYLAVGIPTVPISVGSAYLELHDALSLQVGEVRLELSEYPRFFSYDPNDRTKYRHGPVWIPHNTLPKEYWGTSQELKLYQSGELICGPFDRQIAFEPSSSDITRYMRISGGDGKVILEVDNLEELKSHRASSLTPWIAFFTDPKFGEPTQAFQVHADGQKTELKYEIVGKDYVGSTPLFNEAVLWNPDLSENSSRFEVLLPNPGQGLAMALGAGHSSVDAFRVGVSVE